MRFWDASAVLPLLLSQPRSAEARQFRGDDSLIAVWWGSKVECTSAVVRLLREGAIDPSVAAAALDRLRAIEEQWLELEPSDELREQACRLLRVHPLRASDALQLASALSLAKDFGESLSMVCHDRKLAAAARAERIAVIGAGA